MWWRAQRRGATHPAGVRGEEAGCQDHQAGLHRGQIEDHAIPHLWQPHVTQYKRRMCLRYQLC